MNTASPKPGLLIRLLVMIYLLSSSLSALGNPVSVMQLNPNRESTHPWDLTDVNGFIYFEAEDLTHGFELWKSDGTVEGTQWVSGSQTTLGDLTNVNNTLFFTDYYPTPNGVDPHYLKVLFEELQSGIPQLAKFFRMPGSIMWSGQTLPTQTWISP